MAWTPIEFNAAGVTFYNRQKALAYLTRHNDARITLWREYGNRYDANAIKILATTDKRMEIGYVPKQLAAKLAPVMDARGFVEVTGFQIVGGARPDSSYGMKLYARY